MKASTAPKRSCTVVSSATVSSPRVISAWTTSGGGAPAAMTAADTSSSSAVPHACVSTSCAPSVAKARAVASPIPRVPPVMSTTRPA
jgi:hypothetical protein